MRDINIKKTKKIITNSIQEKFKETQKEKAVVGLSGGLDSTTLAILLRKSLGKERVLGILIPENEQPETEKLANEIGINYKIIKITEVINQEKLGTLCKDRMAEANLKARTRMMILYYAANCTDGLVVGTSNKSEFYTGYFTKYGDGASDYRPLADLYKTEVKKLAKEIGVPDRVINKKPSADLWEGQTDEKELGITYEDLDPILYSYIDLNYDKSELKTEFNSKKVEKVLKLFKNSEHKRKRPEKVKIN